MDKFKLKEYLLGITQNEVKRNGFIFDEKTLKAVSNLISTGVDKMSESDLHDNVKIHLAEGNTMNLVFQMVQYARRRHYHNRITIEVFNNVLSGLCPIWPFC